MIKLSPLIQENITNQYSRKVVWIYGLMYDGKVVYVGSTVDALARYLEHLAGNTCDEVSKGMGEIDMIILDATIEPDRLFIEAKWINTTEGVINKQKYRFMYEAYVMEPDNYECLSDGTLDCNVLVETQEAERCEGQ